VGDAGPGAVGPGRGRGAGGRGAVAPGCGCGAVGPQGGAVEWGRRFGPVGPMPLMVPIYIYIYIYIFFFLFFYYILLNIFTEMRDLATYVQRCGWVPPGGKMVGCGMPLAAASAKACFLCQSCLTLE